jgi:uncharacterized membrane-anchored protein
LLPPNHPDRVVLANEVHARPPEALETPSRISYVAVLFDRDERDRESAHLRSLCETFGVAPPETEANHFAVDFPHVHFKWERHGEFSGYTFVTTGSSPEPYSEPPISRLPTGWLGDIPGRTLFAAHAKLISLDRAEPDSRLLSHYFGDSVVVGAEIGGGAGLAFTDFRLREDGFGRFLILDRSFTPRQAGRMVQRLLEIETYRMLSLLALPLARPLSRQIADDERALDELTSALASPSADDEALLQRLTRLSAEVQGAVTRSQFRFDACRAYHELVKTRIAELREQRIPGIQPIEEFMSRRFSPAVATCASTAKRLRDLADRVGQASALLSTRVDIARVHEPPRRAAVPAAANHRGTVGGRDRLLRRGAGGLLRESSQERGATTRRSGDHRRHHHPNHCGAVLVGAAPHPSHTRKIGRRARLTAHATPLDHRKLRTSRTVPTPHSVITTLPIT